VTGAADVRRARGHGRKPPPTRDTRRRQFIRRFPWPALVSVPLAGVMLVMAAGLTVQWMSLGSTGLHATAVVLAAHPAARAPGTVVVEFQDSAGVRRQANVVVGSRPEVGSSVAVVYSPTDPDTVRFDDDLDSTVVLGFFWLMGISLLVCTRQVMRRARRRV
jgi:hypothetical protein